MRGTASPVRLRIVAPTEQRRSIVTGADAMRTPYATTTTLAPERAIAAAEHFFGKEFHCAPEQHDAHVLAYRRRRARDGAGAARAADDARD